LTIAPPRAKLTVSGLWLVIEESVKQKATKMKSVNKDKQRDKHFVLLCVFAVVVFCLSFAWLNNVQAKEKQAGDSIETSVGSTITIPADDFRTQDRFAPSRDDTVYTPVSLYVLLFAGSVLGLCALGVSSLKVHRW